MAWDESADRFIFGTTTATGSSTGDLTITLGTINANIVGNVTGRADTTTTLHTARTIGGVSFDGSANINLPGVNAAGNQSTSGLAATATALATARTIGGVSFDGTANINLPGVNAAGTQNTSGNAATVTNGVYTTGNQTIAGTKTFSSKPIFSEVGDTHILIGNGSVFTYASISGDATMANNGVLTLAAAQTNITSLGTLTTLTVDNITVNGNTISTGANDLTINTAGGSVYIQDHLKPQADDTYDLGSTGYAWRNLHLEGDITMTDAGTIKTSTGTLTIDGDDGIVLNTTGSGDVTVSENLVVNGTITGTCLLYTSDAADE